MHPWIGRSQTIEDPLDPARADALHVTLGLTAPGLTLLPFGHHIYFWEPQPSERLGPDGHPATGQGLIPDLGLPQRMWAGGDLTFHAPLKLGVAAEKRSCVTHTEVKQGRTGMLGFVTLTHEIRQTDRLCVTERQDLVYRALPMDRRASEPPRARGDEALSESAKFNTTALFRYSALTMNGHRIHYDLDYARDVEGYAGLVVHGPLLAQCLMLLADRQLGRLSRFRFRATAPLMHFEAAELCWADDGCMWVRGPDGRQCMTAEAS